MDNIIIKLDFHMARKTVGMTYWYVEVINGERLVYNVEQAENRGLIKLIHSTMTGGKTHWYGYYEVLNPKITLIRVRVSNRGNLSHTRHKPEELKPSDKELETLKLLELREEPKPADEGGS